MGRIAVGSARGYYAKPTGLQRARRKTATGHNAKLRAVRRDRHFLRNVGRVAGVNILLSYPRNRFCAVVVTFIRASL